MRKTIANKKQVLRGLLFSSLFTLLGLSTAYADSLNTDDEDFVVEVKYEEVAPKAEGIVDVKLMDELGTQIFETSVCKDDLIKRNFHIDELPENSVFLLMYENTVYYYLNGEKDAAAAEGASAKK